MEQELLGGIHFAAKAEVQRQAGDPGAARQIALDGLRDEPASIAGRVALLRALCDLGAIDELEEQLGMVLASLPGFEAELAAQISSSAHSPAQWAPSREEYVEDSLPLAALHDDEMSTAFSVAETEIEEVIDADRVAQDAMREANLDQPEIESFAEVSTMDEVEAVQEGAPLGGSFETGTVARLLEEQGHVDAAQEIRSALAQKNHFEAKTQDENASGRDKMVATLEKWLQNLRGGVQ